MKIRKRYIVILTTLVVFWAAYGYFYNVVFIPLQNDYALGQFEANSDSFTKLETYRRLKNWIWSLLVIVTLITIYIGFFKETINQLIRGKNND